MIYLTTIVAEPFRSFFKNTNFIDWRKLYGVGGGRVYVIVQTGTREENCILYRDLSFFDFIYFVFPEKNRNKKRKLFVR